MKRHLGSLVVAALVVGGIGYVGARTVTAQPSGVVLAQESQDEPAGPQAREPGRHGFGLHRAIRGDLVVPGVQEGTFRNVKIDRGMFAGVEGSTVTIKEDDGKTVDIPTTDDTRIARDGEQATLADFKEGDHVMALRVDEGNGFVTKRVRAISPERWEERKQRRDQRRAHRMQDGATENVG